MNPSIEFAKRVFINEEAELRCGWRIFVFVVCCIVCVVVIGGVLGGIEMLIPSLRLTGEPSDPQEHLSVREVIYLISARAANLIAVVVATVVCARLLERRSFGSVGFKIHPGWSRDFLLGSVIGGSAIALAVGIARLGGAVSIESQAHAGAPIAQRSILLAAAAAALLFLLAAAFEELLFRGFAFQALVHNVGPFVALALSSTLFGAAHLGNPSATTFSTINTMLAGLWLGLAYLATRSLWLATALHFSWNFVMVFVFGLPVSGWVALDRLALLYAKSGSPDWLSGGSYGPEGGLAATIALILATLLIWKAGLFRSSDEMRAAIAHGRSPDSETLSITSVTEALRQVNRTGE
ncbi:MAG: CPBP family intramembrane glutamic endopeptidase [Blastocatellia bacterium]